MSSGSKKFLPPKERETTAIGLTRALLGAMLRGKKQEYVGVAHMLSSEQLAKIQSLAQSGDVEAARLFTLMLGGEAGLVTKEMEKGLAYFLDEEQPEGGQPKPNPRGPEEVEEYWKPLELRGPKEWDKELEMEGGGWRDYTVPLQYAAPPPGTRWKKQTSHPLPEKALPNASLVRALSAHRRQRTILHPDGDDFDPNAVIEVAARIPGAHPFAKTMNKPSIPHLVVLVDCSGSMGGIGGNSGIMQANYASTVLALSAIAARCPFDVIGYETEPHISATTLDTGEQYSRHVSWRPGRARPLLPIRFDAGGSNDMMGATIKTAHHLWKGRDRRTRRIIITIADSDIASTCYQPNQIDRPLPLGMTKELCLKLGVGNYSEYDMTIINAKEAKRQKKGHSDYHLYYAWRDLVDVLVEKDVEAHAMFVGSDISEQWMKNQGRIYTDRFRSTTLCPSMKDMNQRMVELATNILEHAT